MTLADIAKALNAIPKEIGENIAKRAAPRLTELAQASYSARQDPYGASWAGDFDLVQTGTLKSQVKYTASGARVRASLSTRYAKYHTAKVLPGRVLPKAWEEEIYAIAADEIGKAVG